MASLFDRRWEADQRQSGWKARRDQRHRILIRTRMRAGGIPADVCIRDISKRGACIVSAAPPVRGTVVELTGGHMPIVGRVVWVTGRRFGIEVRGSINVADFVTQQQKPAGRSASPEFVAPDVARPAAADSRQTGKAMQFLFVAFLAGCAAAFLGQAVYGNLSRMAAIVQAGLGGAD